MGDEKLSCDVIFCPEVSGDTYEVTVSDDHNNQYKVQKEFSDFVQLAKMINKDIPRAKLELPPRGAKAFIAKLSYKKFQQTRTKRLDEMMKYICAHEVISTHYEVKKFLSLEKLRNRNDFDPAQDPEIESGSSGSGTQGAGQWSSWKNSNMSPSDFNYIMKIGKGSFGHVFLATRANDPTDNQYYAIKILSKELIMAKNESKHINCERQVLIDNMKHPFLVSLNYSFQTPDRLYFVLDFINGGELFFHLQRERSFSEKRAKMYSAEIGSAIGYMHERNLIYRDLKPENILLASDGHICLTDFGLCKSNMYHNTSTDTFCGTPEYLAPEILLKKPYTRSIDWWCLGAVTYEMVYGLPPFYSTHVDEMYQGILHKPLKLKSTVSVEMRSFLSKILEKNPENRLGHAPDGWQQIQNHSFFRQINFSDLLLKKYRPDFIPAVENPTDGKFIDKAFTNSPVTNSINKTKPGSIQKNDPFNGFTYEPSFNAESLQQHRIAMMQEDYL